MKLADAGTFLGAHAIAGLVYILIFGALPLILAIVGLATLLILGILYGDLGGPLFIPMYLIGCLLYALAVMVGGLGLFGVSAATQAFRNKATIPWWVPLITIPLLSLGLFWVTGCTHPIIWATIVTLPFSVYWLSLISAESIAKWIRRKIADKK